jgi:DNA-binding GntR family transcriptional regulator
MHAIPEGDSVAASALQLEFHRLINSFAHSGKLRSAIRPLAQQIPPAFIVLVPSWQREARLMQRRLLDAIGARDGTTAERIMSEHTRQAGAAYIEYLRSQGGVL